MTQTETGWGRIWDDVPMGFPRFPTSTVADDISPDPVSGTYAVDNDDTAQIAGWMQNALETSALRTESLSGPLEDGGFVLESVGRGRLPDPDIGPADGRADVRGRPLRGRLSDGLSGGRRHGHGTWCIGATFAVHPRDTGTRSRVYADNGSGGGDSILRSRGGGAMQSAQPRDIGVLVLVIGMFLILFVVTLTMGAPIR